jgi:hypothetical protein
LYWAQQRVADVRYSPEARVSEVAVPPVPPCERVRPEESLKETASRREAPRMVTEETTGFVGSESRSLNQVLREAVR